jgi:hypothetical protein
MEFKSFISRYAMTRAQIAEAIEVQIAMAQMMPANFGRLSIDAISIPWDLYRASDPSNISMGNENPPLGGCGMKH